MPGASDPSKTRDAVQSTLPGEDEDEHETEESEEEDEAPNDTVSEVERSDEDRDAATSPTPRVTQISSRLRAKYTHSSPANVKGIDRPHRNTPGIHSICFSFADASLRPPFLASSAGPSKPLPPKHKVRVDPTVRTLDSMFPPMNPILASASHAREISNDSNINTQRKRQKTLELKGKGRENAIDVDGLSEGIDSDGSAAEEEAKDGDDDDDDDGIDWKDRGGDDAEVEPPRKIGIGGGGMIQESVCSLSSVRKLRENIRKGAHKGNVGALLWPLQPSIS